jgi:hypothetical protein
VRSQQFLEIAKLDVFNADYASVVFVGFAAISAVWYLISNALR